MNGRSLFSVGFCVLLLVCLVPGLATADDLIATGVNETTQFEGSTQASYYLKVTLKDAQVIKVVDAASGPGEQQFDAAELHRVVGQHDVAQLTRLTPDGLDQHGAERHEIVVLRRGLLLFRLLCGQRHCFSVSGF